MKKYGRAFNHLEDLTFFYGSDGALEALQHLKEINDDASSMRMKWDGGLQIYWGRETEDGPLIFTGHNGWSRGIKSTSGSELFEFITKHSGKNNLTVDESVNRIFFASEFASLYEIFDKATPRDFVGFVYGDALYKTRPIPSNGFFNLYPNGKTGYHIDENSDLGIKIQNSECMVVLHAYFPQFGLTDDSQIPMTDFSFLGNDQLIVINPYYASTSIKIDVSELEHHIIITKNDLDELLSPIDKVSSYKDYFYRYTNFKAKQKELDTLGDDFTIWLKNSNISKNQQQKIIKRIEEFPDAIENMFKTVKYIMHLKNSIIDQLEKNSGDIKTSNSEGWVRYADDKKFGNVKFVPRHRWLP
jgi:hypothetical protein